MKYVHDLVKRRQIYGNRSRVLPAADQIFNLRGDRRGRAGKVGRRRFISEALSHSASECLETYLNGIVQPVITRIVTPKRNDRADSIVLHQSNDRLRLARVVRTKTKDVISGYCERRRGTALTDYENVVRVGVRFDLGDFGAR